MQGWQLPLLVTVLLLGFSSLVSGCVSVRPSQGDVEPVTLDSASSVSTPSAEEQQQLAALQSQLREARQKIEAQYHANPEAHGCFEPPFTVLAPTDLAGLDVAVNSLVARDLGAHGAAVRVRLVDRDDRERWVEFAQLEGCDGIPPGPPAGAWNIWGPHAVEVPGLDASKSMPDLQAWNEPDGSATWMLLWSDDVTLHSGPNTNYQLTGHNVSEETLLRIAASMRPVVGAADRQAQEEEATIAISPRSGPPGTAVQVSVTGFPPGVPVQIVTGLPEADRVVAELEKIGRDGTLTTRVTIPQRARLEAQVAIRVGTIDVQPPVVVEEAFLFEERQKVAGQDRAVVPRLDAEPPEIATINGEQAALTTDHMNAPASNGNAVAVYSSPTGQTIYFPQQAPTAVSMEALLEGRLLLDEQGCLRVDVGEGEGPLVIWHHDFALQLEGDAIDVLNGAGETVGRVGEAIRMGGGEAGSVDLPEEVLAACPGPFWMLGDIEAHAAQAIPDIYPDAITTDKDEELIASFFHQSQPAPEQGLLAGTLGLDQQRCLRVDGYAVLWPPNISPRKEANTVRFVRVENDREETVAVLGEEVRLSSAPRTPDDYRFFENKVYCRGPYWGVARVEPLR